MKERLQEVEREVAIHADERRDGLHVSVVGRGVFLYAAGPRQFAKRDGSGSTTVRALRVWTPRLGRGMWLEGRDHAHLELIDGLIEGEQLRFAGQLHMSEGRSPGSLFVTVRLSELERAAATRSGLVGATPLRPTTSAEASAVARGGGEPCTAPAAALPCAGKRRAPTARIQIGACTPASDGAMERTARCGRYLRPPSRVSFWLRSVP